MPKHNQPIIRWKDRDCLLERDLENLRKQGLSWADVAETLSMRHGMMISVGACLGKAYELRNRNGDAEKRRVKAMAEKVRRQADYIDELEGLLAEMGITDIRGTLSRSSRLDLDPVTRRRRAG